MLTQAPGGSRTRRTSRAVHWRAPDLVTETIPEPATAPPARAPGRPRVLLYLLLAAGLAVRLPLLPLPNTDNDFVFQTWSWMVATQGIHTIYDEFDSPDHDRQCQYPPGYLYVLWLVGKLYSRLLSPEFSIHTIAYLVMLRIPTVMADLATSWLVYRTLEDRAGPRLATGALAASLFSPVMILDSTIVTQIDAVQSLLGLLGVVLLAAGRPVAAIATLALGVLTKPQLVILAPLFVAVVLSRHGMGALVRGAAAAAAVFFALAVPFLLHGRTAELVRTLTGVVGVAPFVSLNAYNFWWIVTGGDGWRPDTDAVLGSSTYRHVGLALLVLALSLGLRRVIRERGRESVVLSAVWTIFAFFMLATEVTERYALGVLPLLLLLVPFGRFYAWLYAVLSVTLFVNLYLVFPLVGVSPWAALSLPHSNFLYYAPPRAQPLPVLLPDWPGTLRAVSLAIAGIHMVVLGLLGWRVARIGPRLD